MVVLVGRPLAAHFIHSPKKHHWVGGSLLEKKCCMDMFLN
jgi:hypothetical protein